MQVRTGLRAGAVVLILLLLAGCTGKTGQEVTSDEALRGSFAADGEVKDNVPIPNEWKMIASSDHNCAIAKDDSLWCWGMGSSGQLGQGDNLDRSVAARVGNENNWMWVTAGSWHTCAIKNDGTLWCWGQNTKEMTQIGPFGPLYNLPAQIGTDANWVQIDSAQSYNCGLKPDGTIWCWGSNFHGQHGDGTATAKLYPTNTVPGDDWISVYVSESHTCGMKSDFSIHCWGQNFAGQLGDGTTVESHVPVNAGSDTDWTFYSAAVASMAIKEDGTLWAWGACPEWWAGGSGNCGHVPTLYRKETNNRFVSQGNHFCLIKNDGSLKCGGMNSNGQVGDGTTADTTEFKNVENGSKWKQVRAGVLHTCGIKEDNTIWCWGRNKYGELGDGTNEDKNVPVAIKTGLIESR